MSCTYLLVQSLGRPVSLPSYVPISVCLCIAVFSSRV